MFELDTPFRFKPDVDQVIVTPNHEFPHLVDTIEVRRCGEQMFIGPPQQAAAVDNGSELVARAEAKLADTNPATYTERD